MLKCAKTEWFLVAVENPTLCASEMLLTGEMNLHNFNPHCIGAKSRQMRVGDIGYYDVWAAQQPTQVTETIVE